MTHYSTDSTQWQQPGLFRRIPPLLLKPLQFAPARLTAPILEAALTAFFADAIDGGDLSELEGRWICLAIADADLEFLIGVANGRPVMGSALEAPDLTIRGNLEEFVLLASHREDPDTQFFQRRLSIEGDTELGLVVKNLIYSLDPERLPASANKLLDQLGKLIEQTRTLGL